MPKKSAPVVVQHITVGTRRMRVVRASELDAKLQFGTGIGKDAAARTRFHINAYGFVEGVDYISLDTGSSDVFLSIPACRTITQAALRRWAPPRRGTPRFKKLRALPKRQQRGIAQQEIKQRKTVETLYSFFKKSAFAVQKKRIAPDAPAATIPRDLFPKKEATP